MGPVSLKHCLLLLLLIACNLGAQQFGPTSLAAESKNNTSNTSTSFTGLADNRTADSRTNPPLGNPIITNPFEIVPTNISKLDPGAPRGRVGDIHNLAYPHFNGKILVETQSWFCTSANAQIARDYSPSNMTVFPTCGNHQIIGYESDTASQSNAAIDDMVSRGFDGFIADSTGDPNGCGFPNFTSSCMNFGAGTQVVDQAIGLMRTHLNTFHSSTMQYAIMEDQSAFHTSSTTSGDCPGGSNQPQCLEAKLLHDIKFYANTRHYFSDSTYLKINGNPVLLFFIDELNPPLSFTQCSTTSPCTLLNSASCTSGSDCWNHIWDTVANQGIALKLIFRSQGGFTHRDTSGSFAWITLDPKITSNPQITTMSQANWDDDFSQMAANDINAQPTNNNYLGGFYHAAECTYNGGCPGFGAFGVAYKGFDREDAGFVQAASQGKVMSQRCGQTWLQTFQKISGMDEKNGNQPYFSAAHQLPFIQVATWDDYDEGSEIETGIDNCVDETPGTSFTISQPDRTSTISWQFKFKDATYGTLSTINRYRMFFTTKTDGTGLSGLDVFPSCTNTNGTITCPGVNLKKLRVWQPGTYRIYIKAIGQPSIVNHMFCAQNQQGCFATFTPSAVSTSVTTLDFGRVPAGSSSTQSLTMAYSGNVDVSGTISVSSSGVFQLQSPSSCLLTQQNPTCQVTVNYSPTSASGDSGSLIISHDGASGVNTVTLAGNGSAGGGCGTGPSVIANIDDVTSWTQTEGSATATLTQNVSAPSIDGSSAQFSLTGGPSYSYAKWENYLGPNDSASEFQLDLQAQIDQPNNAEMIEFGVSQIIGGNTYAFHFACDFKNTGLWRVWNAAANSWSDTSLACTPQTFPAGTWVHLVFDAQRTTSNQLQYNWLSINGVQTSIGQTFGPNIDSPDNVKTSVLLYSDNESDPYSVWIDSMTVTEICH